MMQVMLEGDFTKKDLEELAKWIREKEMKDPKKLYLMLLDKKSTMTMPEGLKLVKDLMVSSMERKFGKYKQVVVNGVSYKVPTRDIVLDGIKGWEVPKKYPKWKDDDK